MEVIFSRLISNLMTNFLTYNILGVFIKTKHDLTDIVIDWTEFKLHQPSSYYLSTLIFSYYKNTNT